VWLGGQNVLAIDVVEAKGGRPCNSSEHCMPRPSGCQGYAARQAGEGGSGILSARPAYRRPHCWPQVSAVRKCPRLSRSSCGTIGHVHKPSSRSRSICSRAYLIMRFGWRPIFLGVESRPQAFQHRVHPIIQGRIQGGALGHGQPGPASEGVFSLSGDAATSTAPTRRAG
jgi:hypothetical protein